MARPASRKLPDLRAAEDALKEASMEVETAMLANPPRSGEEIDHYGAALQQFRIARRSHSILEDELEKFCSPDPAVRAESRFTSIKEVMSLNSNVRDWVSLYASIVQRKRDQEVAMSRDDILRRIADMDRD